MKPDLDELARTMVRAPDIARDYVIERLQTAARVIEVTSGRVGPAGVRGFWVQILRDGWDTLPDPDRRPRFDPTPRQVTLAEEALEWRRYVSDADCLRALNIWLAGKATRRPWQKLAEQHGLSRETAKRRQSRAISLIVYGLARDGFQPPADD